MEYSVENILNQELSNIYTYKSIEEGLRTKSLQPQDIERAKLIIRASIYPLGLKSTNYKMVDLCNDSIAPINVLYYMLEENALRLAKGLEKNKVVDAIRNGDYIPYLAQGHSTKQTTMINACNTSLNFVKMSVGKFDDYIWRYISMQSMTKNAMLLSVNSILTEARESAIETSKLIIGRRPKTKEELNKQKNIQLNYNIMNSELSRLDFLDSVQDSNELQK